MCFFPKPKVAVTQTGTMLTIESECSNCGETHTWKSQPDLLGRFPAGNLLLNFAVLCAGASIRKVLLVFRHMGMLVYNEPTYYYHHCWLLEEVPEKTARKVKRSRSGAGWWWLSWQRGPFGQVRNVHNVWLYHCFNHPHCSCAGAICILYSKLHIHVIQPGGWGSPYNGLCGGFVGRKLCH